MKKINPFPVGLIMFFGWMFNAHHITAQHLLEYAKQRKVIKVVAEQGNSLYYRNWPDTIYGSIHAIWVSEITSLKPLSAGEVDSVFAQLSMEAEQRLQNNVEDKLVKRARRKLTVVEVDVNTAIALHRGDAGAGFAIGRKKKNGISIFLRGGVDYTNQGRGFIYTMQMPLGLQVNYDMLSHQKGKGTPFLQVAAGYNFVRSGRFDPGRERTGKYNDYERNQLDNNIFFSMGGGVMYKNRYRIGVSYKLQGSNVIYPEIGYTNFLLLKLAMRLI